MSHKFDQSQEYSQEHGRDSVLKVMLIQFYLKIWLNILNLSYSLWYENIRQT